MLDPREIVRKVALDPRAQRIKRCFEMRAHRLTSLANALPPVLCVDVGASFFPHTSWWLFLDSSVTHWVAVEPNEGNLRYLERWPWAASVEACPFGLSGHGGEQTLYLTNVDTGSSLLEPVLPSETSHRLVDGTRDYFFPFVERAIETRTLVSVAESAPLRPIIVKLDTQGTELAIVEPLLRDERFGGFVVGVEMECSLLAFPHYKGAPRLWEVARVMEEGGFEPLLVDVFPRPEASRIPIRRNREIVNECDVVWGLRPDVARSKQVEVRTALFAFYVTNGLYREAIMYLDSDREMEQFLAQSGGDVVAIRRELASRI